MKKRSHFQNLRAHPIDPNTGCINFLGAINKGGYGCITVEGKVLCAPRFFYAKYKGPIIDKLWVLHRCNNPRCVNPEHLYLGTSKDNAKDREKGGRYTKPVFEAITEDQYKILANVSYTEAIKVELTGLSKGTVYRATPLAMIRKRAESTKPLTSLELLLAKARAELASKSMKEFK